MESSLHFTMKPQGSHAIPIGSVDARSIQYVGEVHFLNKDVRGAVWIQTCSLDVTATSIPKILLPLLSTGSVSQKVHLLNTLIRSSGSARQVSCNNIS